EAGHFLAAKRLGIAVEEFAVGFGPVVWAWRRGETRYSLRLLPLGGFVRLAGESGETAEIPFERTYYGQPAWTRLVLALSGPLANVVLAVALVVGAILGFGLPRPRVAGLVPGRPAAEVFEVGDVILAINGRSAWATEDVGAAIRAVAPEPVTFGIRRGGQELDVSVAPVFSEEEGRYLVGAYFSLLYERPPIGEGVVLSFKWIGGAMAGFVAAIRGLITRDIPAEEVIGPVGIATLLGQRVMDGPLIFFLLVALISLNLALVNLIPFPALDGARMAFALYEVVTRRKVSPRVETAVHAAGFVVLLGLMILIAFQDLRRLFG
ncbi:TPA: RIP metalloprotease RseP, partial [Candidatus Acetothermia bacterium]|nr:RIP metalloprotease RseP [Candidatus Acetothermia bacterium]